MLTKDQKKALPGVRWVTSPQRASGKTYLLCYVAIENAKNFRQPQYVFDHYFYGPEFTRIIGPMLGYVIENEFPDDKFVVTRSGSSVKVEWEGKC
jgi:hypothetical protein